MTFAIAARKFLPPPSFAWLNRVQQRHSLKRLLDYLEINAAVSWSILSRGWQVLAGAMSFILLSKCLTGDERGYYMTFWSFVQFQSLVDLGFTIVVTNFSSHEWALLHLDKDGFIRGDEKALSRLTSLGRFAAAWFGCAAILSVAVVGIPGAYVFSSKSQPEIHWMLPWWTTVVLSSASLFFAPFMNLLEGCGQLERVYRFRLFQAVTTNLLVWSSLLMDGRLWTTSISAGFRFLSELYFLGIVYGHFFRPFRSPPKSDRILWKKELWPVLWRLSVGGAFSYFAFFLFNPVMMYYHSPRLAGQMGMTRQLLITIQSASQSWVQVRVPELGRLVATRKFDLLDQRFRRLTALSALAFLAAGTLYMLGIPIVNHYAPKLGESLLGFWPTLVMILGMLCFQLPYSQTQYLRAHKEEPAFLATMASNVTIGLAVWLLGWQAGALGAAWGYTLAVITVTVPGIHFVWQRYRVEYRKRILNTGNLEES